MSLFADKLLNRVKLTLREASNDFDDDIKADIESAALDLMQAGILPFFFNAESDSWEVDPLILRAVKWYCLSVYGLYNADMEKYDTAYRSLKSTLATQTRYARNADEPLMDAELQDILRRLGTLEDRLENLEFPTGCECAVDDHFSTTSFNPVQNKVIATALGDIETALDAIIAIQEHLIGSVSV